MLEALGFGPLESGVYDLLATHGRMRLEAVVAAGHGDVAEVQRALDTLVSKGLVRRLAGSDQEYVVAPPEPAIEALVAEQMATLRKVRAQSAELTARVRRLTQGDDPAELLEVVTGDGAVSQLFVQATRSAREEIAVFDCPPYLMRGPRIEEEQEEQAERMRRDGLRFRTVFDRSLLEDPFHVRRILDGLGAGEEGRIGTVPLKLAVVDREWALLPLLHADGSTPEAAVVVRKSVLVDSMVALFDSVWDHAAELRVHGSDELAEVRPAEAELRQLSQLMAAGMTDVAIARHLGLSERTLRRRTKELMDALGADSRFVAGVRAAQRGWA